MEKTKHLQFMLLFFLMVQSVMAQVTVSGTVTDASGQVLIGTTVFEEGTANGTNTDLDGTYSLQVKENSTIEFSFTGYETQKVNVGRGGQYNISLREDANILEEVFITATSKPIRRIEATTAIESISAKEIERMDPTSLGDLVRFTPGVFVQNKAGRTRNFIYIRGFPDGLTNGFLYTSLLFDGLKSFGSPEMVPDGAFRQDLNVDRVEIVRGSAGTLYGRGSAAGAVNVISRTGGEESKGKLKATIGDHNWYQLDANINGPLSADKSWRYNIGGFYLTDDGYRDGPAGDKGGQFRFNIDKIISKSSNIRLYGGYIDLDVNNYLDIPYAINDLTKPAEGWSNRDVTLGKGNAWEGQAWPVNYPEGEVASNNYDDWFRRGNFSQGWNLGSNQNFDLGDGWTLSNKARVQNIIVGVAFDFPINNVGGSGNSSVATFGDTQLRAIIGGGRTDGGTRAKEFLDEIRINKVVKAGNSEHNFTLGGFIGRSTFTASADGGLYSINTSSKESAQSSVNINPFFPGVSALSFRNSTSKENTTSFFFGDEMRFNNKLTLNLGARYDIIQLKLADNKGTSEELAAEFDHSGLNYSAGFNYLLTDLSAFYGNISFSYRAPDFGTYTPVREGPVPGTLDKPEVTENERTRSMEIGYRNTSGDFSFDVGLFANAITNRRLATYIGAIATQVPAGDNFIKGAEMSLIYTPQSLNGLYARTSLTLQDTEVKDFRQTITYINPADPEATITEDFDFEGNGLTDMPPLIWNVSLGYSNGKFGFNIHNNMITDRWADPYNTVKYPGRSITNANAFVKFGNIRVGVGSTNLLNNKTISSAISVRGAGQPTLYVANKFNNQGVHENIFGLPLLPRRFFGTMTYDFGLKGKSDRDGDGIADKKDACPDDAGLKEFNGCPDSDMDGIVDSEDSCPNAAGPAASFGCPDSDGDGFLDKEDDCPNTAGTVSGCPDADGDGVADRNDDCPNAAGTLRGCPDGDGDGIADKNDDCPTVAGKIKGCPDGDGDGVADKDDKCLEENGDGADGCPSFVDSDGDGVQDSEDRCPEVKGTINGCPDSDRDGIVDIDDKCPNRGGAIDASGCPKVVPSDAVAVFNRVPREVNFNTASDVIKPSSYGILAEVVSIMNRYPDLNISIDGYTDDRGDADKNQDLSSRRSVAVLNYLMEKGVSGSRMGATGYGEANPTADNNTAAGRKLNRRVEMIGRY